MRPVKNKRRIDPRYFLNETAGPGGLETLLGHQALDNAAGALGGRDQKHRLEALYMYYGMPAPDGADLYEELEDEAGPMVIGYIETAINAAFPKAALRDHDGPTQEVPIPPPDLVKVLEAHGGVRSNGAYWN